MQTFGELMNTGNLRTKIISAFADVTLGRGVGLWESQAIDDYAKPEVQARERRRDERSSWQSISFDDLSYANSSLSFVDAEGMRFLLPAYMAASLAPTFDWDPVYHLIKGRYEAFELLNSKQRKAVVAYLEWYASHSTYDRTQIKQAINEYWSHEHRTKISIGLPRSSGAG